MAKPLLLRSAAELLEIILTGSLPADAQMDRYFRAHRQMGVRDRGQVAEAVYGALRERRVLAHVSDSEEPVDLLVAWWITQGISARALETSGYRRDTRAVAERVRTLDRTQLPFPIRTNLPDWLAEKLRTQFGETEALALAEALNRPAPVDLRVNTLKGEREALQARLAQDGIDTNATPYSPAGLRRDDRAPLFHTSAFKEGWFELQDEGSQLISYLVEPRRHEMVADFCAGAGGKTLHLGALMANSGTLYAFDTAARRLDRLKPRLRRAGLDNIRNVAIAHERDDRVQRLKGKLDRVLVDAPCSGTGTLRRNPDIKWRQLDIDGMVATQLAILKAAAALVKPGGRLVYATCSVLHEENEAVVERFLAEQPPFQPVPVSSILERRHIQLPTGDALRLLPHRHNTDGFYAVVLERQAKADA
jgi:16S rRNA (cytosine967-C5)-methyltransferase